MQDIDLDIPYEPRTSPDMDTARARNLDWLTSAGLITSEENKTRYLTWELADLAARFYPNALGEDLELALQGQSFVFFFDDLFDSPLGKNPAVSYAICHEMAALARVDDTAGAAEPSFPLAHVWLDHWSRAKRGMSAAWRARAARNWQRWFLSYVAEAMDRKSGTVLDIDRYMQLRRVAIGADPVLDTAERCEHYEVPAHVHESTCMWRMRDLTSEVVTLVNDLNSLEKDAVNGEPNNIVLLLRRERPGTMDEAVLTVQAMIRKRIERFEELAAEAERLGEALALSAREREAVARFVDTNRACMRGTYDWGRRSGRYDQMGIEYVKRSPRIEDLVASTGHAESA